MSDREVAKLLRAARKKEKETGQSVGDQLLALIYAMSCDVTPREKISAIKCYYDQVVADASERDVTVTQRTEPAIYLPESLPDPAKVAVIAGGKK